jgi:hypothetical protein
MADTLEEAVWDIAGTPEVEKVFLQDEAKLYRTRAVLGYIENKHFDYTGSTITTEFPVVPVENDEGKLIGFANLTINKKSIWADISIDYSTPERLSAELRDGERVFPRMVGELVTREENPSPFVDLAGGRRVVVSLKVSKVVLSSQASSDKRLQPLGEPVLL